MRVGLTGGVAAGKTAVAEIWRDEGVPVVSADDLSREAVQPGTPGLREIVAFFGEEILRPDGRLDRAALRSRVFHDEAERAELESILHPRIGRLRREWMEARRAEGRTVAVSEIPLLFEAGMDDEFDRVVVVDAPADERLRRLMEDRGLEREEALRIMRSQMDADEKRRRADVVIVNDGDLGTLGDRAREALARLRIDSAAEGTDGATRKRS